MIDHPTAVQWKSVEWRARAIQSQQPGDWKIDVAILCLCDITRDRLPGEGSSSHGNRTCPGSPLGQGQLVPTSTRSPFVLFLSISLSLSLSLPLSRGYRITGVCLPSFPCFRFSFLFRRISRNFSSVPFDTRSLVAKVFFHSVTSKLFEIEYRNWDTYRFFFHLHFAERESF